MSSLQRGALALQSKNLDEAVEWFRKAVAETPTDAQAEACLGQALCWQGRREEGLTHLRRSGSLLLKLARKTREVSNALQMVDQLQFWEDFPASVELARQIVQIDRSSPRGFQLLALAYSRLNQGEPALAAGRQAQRLAPDSAVLAILLATLEAGQKQYEPARRRLENLLSHHRSMTPEEGFRARKELAGILDKQGEHGQVFAHLHASAKLSGFIPEVQQQDAKLVPRLLDAYREEYDAELLGRWAGSAFPDDPPAPLFVVGFMRSGTTLTQEVLGAHPEVFVADETDLIVATVNELGKMVPALETTPQRLRQLDLEGIRRLRRFYWNQARGRFGDRVDRKVFLDKTTMNTLDLGFINCVFPDAKVVFVMRDPRDVCLSCFMQIMTPTPSTVHLLSWQGTARFYAQVMSWWNCVKPRMTIPFVEFRYEDAVPQFEQTFKEVFDFVGLPWDPRVADFHRRAVGKYIASPSFNQVAQPLYNSSVGRWRNYRDEFGEVAETLEPFVSAYGYEA